MIIGRFAPTPSGPLHFGSLLAALASYLDAKSQNGRWLVRIEDLDSPRCPPGADSEILKTLESFGLVWDDEVVYQSKRTELYRDAFEKLKSQNLVYSCSCSRKDILAASSAGHTLTVYPKICRNKIGNLQALSQRTSRLKTESGKISFLDGIQGEQSFDIETDVGDFVLQRVDGFFAYHLAVVVDDAAQSVTNIVRGSDLLTSTPHHILLQRLLSYDTPRYSHIPVATNREGEKLSKQTLARPIDPTKTTETLKNALDFLGQKPIEQSGSLCTSELLEHAVKNWHLELIEQCLVKVFTE